MGRRGSTKIDSDSCTDPPDPRLRIAKTRSGVERERRKQTFEKSELEIDFREFEPLKSIRKVYK